MKNNNHENNLEHANGAHEPWGAWSGMVAGLMIGGLAGSTAMLLLAPQSGRRTRAKIQRAGNDVVEQTSDAVEDAVSTARDKTHQLAQDVRKQAEGLEKRGHAMLDGKKARVEE